MKSKMKKIYLLTLFVGLSLILHAQVPPVTIEGAANIITLEAESFETGLGNFTNTGSTNWTTTNTDGQTGQFSATSNIIVAGQDAILSLNVNVPTGFTAILQFYVRPEITHMGGLNNRNGRVSFSIDGVAESTRSESSGWEQKVYFLSDGAHTLDWSAFHTSGNSQDEVSIFLDDVLITYNEKPSLKIVDGTEGMGKVLVSDEYGNAGWISLSAIADFDNSSGNALLPLELDGNHQITNTLTVLNAGDIGIKSISNGGDGITAEDNGGHGFYATANAINGFYAFSNAQHGYFAFDNDNDGYLALSNDRYGFFPQEMAQMGFGPKRILTTAI